MEYKVVSETIQELNGERFYLCGKYYQHNGKRLHRAVGKMLMEKSLMVITYTTLMAIVITTI